MVKNGILLINNRKNTNKNNHCQKLSIHNSTFVINKIDITMKEYSTAQERDAFDESIFE